MKILSVELENLNSLVGKTKIDFTDPLFASSGIFAIVGPTGSGKTTILDAICLALFGRTPRLKSISQSENEIMSRGTGFCSAEVVFETNRNGTFLCSWYQQRANKKPDGNLQKPKHEIAEPSGNDSGNNSCNNSGSETTWKPIETKLSKVTQIVEEKTGMNFDRFTRSMLLAQGDFDKFLQSDAKDRSEILEQITGTEIYGDISRKVHERNKEEQNKLQLIETELRGMTVYNIETIEEKRAIRNQLKQTIETTEKRLRELTQLQQHFERIARLENEAQKLEEEWKTFCCAEIAFQPEAKQLAMAMKALELEPKFNILETHRQNLETEKTDLETVAKKLPSANEKLMSIREEERRATEELNVAQEKQKTGSEILRRVRELDTKIKGFDETIKTVQQQINQLETDRQIRQKNVTNLKKQLAVLLKDKTLESLAQTLEEQEKNTEKLLTGKKFSDWAQKQAEISQQIQNWKHLRTSEIHLAKIETEKSDLMERVKTAETIIQETESKRQDFVQKIEQAKQNVAELETEWMSLNRISALEEHRKYLHNGQPCPLCGALEHPFTHENVPKPDQTASKLDKAKQYLNELTQTWNKIEIEQKTSSREFSQLQLQINENIEKSKQEQLQIDDLLKHLALDRLPSLEIMNDKIKNAEQNVQEILNNIAEEEKFRTEIESLQQLLREGQNLQDKLNNENEILRLLDTQHQRRTEELETWSKQRLEQIEQRTTIFGNKNPDDAELQYAKSVQSAQQTSENIFKKRQETENEYSFLKQRYVIVEKNIADIYLTITGLCTEFDTLLQQTGFNSEDEFKSSRLAPETRRNLETEKQRMETERIQLETRRNENKTALENETAEQQQNQADAKQILSEYKELTEKMAAFQQEIGAIDSQLNQYENDTIKQLEKKKEQEKQRNICDLWYTLDDLIGSADGKKYRTFAQGLTFRMMLDYANQQLEKMTDRYHLLYNDFSDRYALELVVIDAYQAGAIRSTKNLSGGESFLVSLALALGLSSMSSQHVRVDSLFLDEGFGSLDEQTLDTALNVLEGLRQEGKQIGIISHIPAIRERIAVQIQVRPVKEKQNTATVLLERS
ncbi:MAG: AAA family ATPase [Planctomycetaceae bacterium]|jgi:exonuclease SbcC|nr:AAA family ATPase [Planctomycetaceae bacterium]